VQKARQQQHPSVVSREPVTHGTAAACNRPEAIEDLNIEKRHTPFESSVAQSRRLLALPPYGMPATPVPNETAAMALVVNEPAAVCRSAVQRSMAGSLRRL
jgi:hypothetical protein